MKFTAGVLSTMVAVFCAIFFWPHESTTAGSTIPLPPIAANASADTFPCTVAHITDGDTFRCEEVGSDGKQIRIRLSGVAARERDGSCTVGHPCPTASAEAATAELTRLATGKQLECDNVGKTYERIAAFCRLPDGADLSCSMVASGTTVRWEKYWKDGPSCP